MENAPEAPATAYRRLGICAFDSWGIFPASMDHSTSDHDDCHCLDVSITAKIVWNEDTSWHVLEQQEISHCT